MTSLSRINYNTNKAERLGEKYTNKSRKGMKKDTIRVHTGRQRSIKNAITTITLTVLAGEQRSMKNAFITIMPKCSCLLAPILVQNVRKDDHYNEHRLQTCTYRW
jgi:hypothetical protein